MDVKPSAANGSRLAGIAAALIEKCVHCGFCLPACPTYGLDHDERDSPRGRIYLVKKLVEGGSNAATVRKHLDRCLHCRSCEPACPSGVQYGQIAQLGRRLAAEQEQFGLVQRLWRLLLGEAARSRFVGKAARVLANSTRVFQPAALRRVLAKTKPDQATLSGNKHDRSVTVLAGCAQVGLMPESNQALLRLLDMAGYNANLVVSAPCCGAIRAHTGRHAAALEDVRRVIGACTRNLDQGDEKILMAASGCASFLAECPHLPGLGKSDIAAADKVAGAVVDVASFLCGKLDTLQPRIAKAGQQRAVAVHVPCSQCNGLNASQATAALLRAAGFDVHEGQQMPGCCGSAGTYSLFHPAASKRLRNKMVAALERLDAPAIASANIGCILHLRAATERPVHHWLDLLSESVDNQQ